MATWLAHRQLSLTDGPGGALVNAAVADGSRPVAALC